MNCKIFRIIYEMDKRRRKLMTMHKDIGMEFSIEKRIMLIIKRGK